MRANRMLGAALAEHGLVKLEDLELANERLLELVDTGMPRQVSVLGVLVYEMKVLREEDLLQHVVDEQGIGLVDLRGYEVPDEVKKDIEIGECWATWSIPYDREEDFFFVASAYYLSPTVRSLFENKLGGQIIWQATTMEIIADFLEKLEQERANPQGIRPGTIAPFGTPPQTVPVAKTPTAAPFGKPPTAAPFGKPPTAAPFGKTPTAAPFGKPSSGAPKPKAS
ncbi:MAG: hypothetical protein PHQ04_02785 [Opitutaceae bacterium]|nr:hypothetical protein [Opitutaceae bacterium]